MEHVVTQVTGCHAAAFMLRMRCDGYRERERELIEAKSLMFVRYYHPRPMDGDVNEMSQQFFETASALWKRNFEVKLLTPRMK